MCKPHPHKDLIIAWGSGFKIQYKTIDGKWMDCCDDRPAWFENREYRIKPEEKKPVKRWQWTYQTCKAGYHCLSGFLYSEEEAQKQYENCYSYKKLPYTEMEFEE